MNVLASCLATLAIVQVVHVQCGSIGGVSQAQAQVETSDNDGSSGLSGHKPAKQTAIDETFQGEGGKVKGANEKINDGSSFVRMQMKNRLPNKAIITTNNMMRNRKQGIVLSGEGFRGENKNKKNILPLFPEYPEELALINRQLFSPTTTLSSFDLNDRKLATTNHGGSQQQNKIVAPDRQSEFANQVENKCLEGDNKDCESLLPNEINYLDALPENKRKSGMFSWPFSRSSEDRLSSKSIDLDLRLAFKLPEEISGL